MLAFAFVESSSSVAAQLPAAESGPAALSELAGGLQLQAALEFAGIPAAPLVRASAEWTALGVYRLLRLWQVYPAKLEASESSLDGLEALYIL